MGLKGRPAKEGEALVKEVGGKTYHFCSFHKEWTVHPLDQCKLNPKNKDKSEGMAILQGKDLVLLLTLVNMQE